MIIPNTVNGKLVDDDGNITPEWELFFSQLINVLQTNLSNEGYVLPMQSTTDIAKLSDVTKSKGALIYDLTLDKFKVNINGTWKVVTVT